MTTASKPVVYMIVMPDNPISMYYRGRVESSWADRGFKLEYFKAVTPQTIAEQKHKLQFGLKQSPNPNRIREFSETEKAVWYSHFGVWNIARRKQSPIIVIEHDTLLLKPINSRIFKNVKMMGLCHSLLKDGTMGTTAGAGYYLTRDVADEMCRETMGREIRSNSDALIHRKIDKYGANWKTHYCEQIRDDSVGTTIHHG